MEAANCEYDPNSMDKVATIRGYQSLPQNDVQPILDHLTNKGPLSALMYASTIKDYESGVFDGCSYNESISVNHAVQVWLVLLYQKIVLLGIKNTQFNAW